MTERAMSDERLKEITKYLHRPNSYNTDSTVLFDELFEEVKRLRSINPFYDPTFAKEMKAENVRLRQEVERLRHPVAVLTEVAREAAVETMKDKARLDKLEAALTNSVGKARFTIITNSGCGGEIQTPTHKAFGEPRTLREAIDALEAK